MIVSHDFHFAYIRPPRTASGTITKALSIYKCQGIEGEFPHQTVWKPEFDGYFTFISVRNPFPRMVSLWKIMTADETKLLDWIDEVVRQSGKLSFHDYVLHPAMQSELRRRCCYMYACDAPRINAVVRYEHLRQELHRLPFVRRPLELGEKHKSEYSRPWWEEYDDVTIEHVRSLWIEDFEAYGYSDRFEDAIR